MMHPSKTLYAMAFSAVLAGISGGAAALAYPGGSSNYDINNATSTTGLMGLNGTDTASSSSSSSMMDQWGMMSGNHTGDMGMITGMTSDAQGNPAWLLAGHWKLSTTDSSDNSSALGTNMTEGGNLTDFHAVFTMVMLNGSAMHQHELSNFTQTEEATFNSTANSTTYIGTSTVTMRDGPVSDVATQIAVSQNVIKIELDPTAVNNHFGDSAIYGVAVTPDMMMKAGGHGWMSNGTMTPGATTGNMTTGTLYDSWQDNNSNSKSTTTSSNSTMDEMWK